MRSVVLSFLFVAAAGCGWAQQWEFGGNAGAGILSHVGVSSPNGSATAGFSTGPAFGVFLGHSSYSHFSGELHYGFLMDSLRLASGGTTATFGGQSHVFHYDLVWHTKRGEAKREFFVAAGGGGRLFRGTGQEQAYQPLSQFGYFTNTQAFKPMISVGGGVRFALSHNLLVRAEVRDYITAFPSAIITPAPGTSFGNILQTIVPTVGISYLF